MALAATSMVEIRQDATANNVNGGGFNPGNANFLTDLAATSATGNSPVVTSASYTFVAGDDETWIYVKSGTNWTAGFYQIASVSGGAATLRAAIGESVQYNASQGRWMPSTVAGCATVASPTAGTFGCDYSQQAAAQFALTGLTTAAADAILLTASASTHMVGNHLRITGGTNFTTGWYEIVSAVAGVSLTLDRTCTSAAGSAGTANVGGAMSLNSTLDDDLFESGTAGMIWWVRYNATAIALGEAVSIAAAGTAVAPYVIEGYASVRGDRPTGSTRPVIDAAANAIVLGTYWSIRNSIVTGTASVVFTSGNSGNQIAVKITCPSTSANRTALTATTASAVFSCELISYRGYGHASANSSANLLYCYIHDCDIGFRFTGTSTSVALVGCIIESCVTAAIVTTGAATGLLISENTLFGSVNTTGIGLSAATGSGDYHFFNNIISGFVTGVSHADTQASGFDNYNCYYNNDADVSAVGQWQKGPNDVTTNPSFTNVGQVTGTGATTDGSGKLVDTAKNFTSLGVVANQDHVYISSATGVTVGIYAITAISTTTNPNDTLTLTPTPSTGGTNVAYQITTGHDFKPTGSI